VKHTRIQAINPKTGRPYYYKDNPEAVTCSARLQEECLSRRLSRWLLEAPASTSPETTDPFEDAAFSSP
jgi:hypothetical protein